MGVKVGKWGTQCTEMGLKVGRSLGSGQSPWDQAAPAAEAHRATSAHGGGGGWGRGPPRQVPCEHTVQPPKKKPESTTLTGNTTLQLKTRPRRRPAPGAPDMLVERTALR